MASADDIETAMNRQLASEKQQNAEALQEVARLHSIAKEAAEGFVELMRKHGVSPERVYGHEFITIRQRGLFAPKSPKLIDRFQPADQGWVVMYSLDDYNNPSYIQYLRPDGLINDCDIRATDCPGHLTEGLASAPERTVFGPAWALCTKPYSKAKPPFRLTVDQCAVAARRYLSP